MNHQKIKIIVFSEIIQIYVLKKTEKIFIRKIILVRSLKTN